TLVGHFLVRQALELTGAALDRALDVVLRHVAGLRFRDGRAQARIARRVAAAETRCNRHFLQDAGEDLAALRVGGTLLVLDRAPFAMPGHESSSVCLARTHSLSFFRLQ